MFSRLLALIALLLLPALAAAAPSDRSDPADPTAVCDRDVVWRFVADALAHAPECKSWPAWMRARAKGEAWQLPESIKDCHGIEWAVLDSECLPAQAYFHDELTRHVGEGTEREGYCVSAQFGRYGRQKEHASAQLTPSGQVICAGTDAFCGRSPGCAEEGLCGADFGRCIATDAGCAESAACKSRGACERVHGRCQPTRASHCEASRACEESGACALVDDTCVRAEVGCEESLACKNRGACTLVDGVCVVTDAGCRATRLCRAEGKCHAVDGECVALEDDDCRASENCTNEMKACVAFGGECVRPLPQVCAVSRSCREEGRCHSVWSSDRCVRIASQADCDHYFEREQLYLDGRCLPLCSNGPSWAVGEDATTCVEVPSKEDELAHYKGVDHAVAPEAGCADTRACKEAGYCERDGSFCVLSEAGCAASTGCREKGLCSASDEGNSCVATDAGCAASTGCSKYDACLHVGIRCEQPRDAGCPEPGVIIGGRCTLPADFDCATTELCRDHGVGCAKRLERDCTADGECGPSYAVCHDAGASCATSDQCRKEGRCGPSGQRGGIRDPETLSDLTGWARSQLWDLDRVRDRMVGECLLTDDGCKASEACARSGRCSANTSSSYCRPRSREHCEASEICRTEGACGLQLESTYYTCGPTRADHCLGSQLCQSDGACFLHGEICETADVVGAEPCADTPGCREHGACHWRGGECQILTDADCEASAACRDGGRCVLRHGTCHSPSYAASLDAICAEAAGAEVAAWPFGPACEAAPLPDPRRDRIRAASEEEEWEQECAASTGCESDGACARQEGYGGFMWNSFCGPATEEHCAQSQACAEEGHCGRVVQWKEYGAGSYGTPLCLPTQPEHCARSKACKRDGRCVYRAGVCLTAAEAAGIEGAAEGD